MSTKKKNFLKAKVVFKKEDNKITVIASDETLDRHGDVLPIEAWDLSQFNKAPRMLVDHDHRVQSIVGKWANARIEGKQLLMDADFHGITDLSKAVKEMVEKGYLDTVSVGFIYNPPEKDGDRPSFELIETSWVTVPANPSARVQRTLASAAKSLLGKELTDDEKQKIKDFAGEKEVDPEDEHDTEPEDAEEPLADELDEIENQDDDKDEDEEDEEDEIQANSAIVDRTPEGFEKEGYVFIRNAADFAKSLESDDQDCVRIIDLAYLIQLVADSEKLKTLTDADAVAKRSAETMKLAFKEAAHIVNDALMKLNSNSKQS